MDTPAAAPAVVDPLQAAREAREAEQAAHYALLEQLDIHAIPKSFRSPTWKPNQRRNKNIKTILGDAQRRADQQAASSLAATPAANHNGGATPNNGPAAAAASSEKQQQQQDTKMEDYDDENNNEKGLLSTSGTATPANDGTSSVANSSTAAAPPNLAQASRSLSKLVLEKSLRNPSHAAGAAAGSLGTGAGGGGGIAPSATYTNIESAPSLAPARKYCDVTGLKGCYQDPKTRLRYYNAEVFGLIRALPQGYAERYLEARGAHVVLK